MRVQSDEERLLSILHAHGQQFLGAFGIPVPKHEGDTDGSDSESAEEWTGLGSSDNRSLSGVASDAKGSSDFEQGDDFVGCSSRIPDVTVSLGSTPRQQEVDTSAKELRKLFMSSKVSDIVSSSVRPMSKGKICNGELENERTNAQNDALLHRLVHTQLLSGAINPEFDLDHAQKGKALAGRVLEMSGRAKLGKGESMVRQEQRNKAATRVRVGLIRKQREKEERTLEEAKNSGNYHPTLKQLYGSSQPARKKKRVRGLGMGVGRFVGGTLKLSRDEIVAVSGTGKGSRGDSRPRVRR